MKKNTTLNDEQVKNLQDGMTFEETPIVETPEVADLTDVPEPEPKTLADKVHLDKGVTLYTGKGISAADVLGGRTTSRASSSGERTTTRRRTTPRKKAVKAGDVVTKRSAGFVGNVKQNMTKHFAETVGLAAIGATSYVLIPTLLQAMTKRDLTGWRGFGIGLASASIIGLGLNKPEIAIGALAASGTHLLYSKGSQAVKNMTGVPLYRMAAEGTEAQLQDRLLAGRLYDDVGTNQLPAGTELVQLPDGRTELAYTATPKEPLPPNAEWVTLPDGQEVYGFKDTENLSDGLSSCSKCIRRVETPAFIADQVQRKNYSVAPIKPKRIQSGNNMPPSINNALADIDAPNNETRRLPRHQKLLKRVPPSSNIVRFGFN